MENINVPVPARMDHDIGPMSGGIYQQAIAKQLSWLAEQKKGRKTA
jgi:hypothetical protein